ncbi:MAG: trehalose-phosphatase [Acidimicrobiia bacterium]
MLDGRPKFIDDLDSALDNEFIAGLGRQRLAFFLDYDGTMTPLVAHPEDAILTSANRATLGRLAAIFPVAVVSGRDRADVEALVGLPDIYYAGSHGFDITGPEGVREVFGSGYLESLSEAGSLLASRIGGVKGVWIELKGFAVALHFRQAADSSLDEIRRAVEDVARQTGGLRVSGGKKVLELRPDIDWGKGHAVVHLLELLGLSDGSTMPIYIGDDETDEDVFRVFTDRPGVGIVVGTEHRPTLADRVLTDPDETMSFLSRIAETASGRSL